MDNNQENEIPQDKMAAPIAIFSDGLDQYTNYQKVLFNSFSEQAKKMNLNILKN